MSFPAGSGNNMLDLMDPLDRQVFPCIYYMDMDGVFKTLADPTRRRLLDQLPADNGQTLGELCGNLDMTRQAVSQHLTRLETANLVATVR